MVIYKALFHQPWYITKYTTHFKKYITLRGRLQNIPRKVKISLPVIYSEIYRGKWQLMDFHSQMRSGNDADILHVRQLIGRLFGPLAGLSFF